MAMKAKAKTGARTTTKTVKKTATTSATGSATTRMTTVSFRTRQLLKKKAEGIFEDMGISTSAAINMFLSQVVREKGMPFTPSAQRKNEQGVSGTTKVANDNAADSAGYIALEELWNEL